MAKRRGQLRIGTSGWQYDHWRGRFYPSDFPKKRWFEHYAEHFDTVEINNTFYKLPSAETFDEWRKQTRPDFRYALKFSRYGSHIKRLKDPEQPIGMFTERADRLGSHLGPILVQLPPRWSKNVDRLAGFLEAAPRKYRWVIEFRDESWLSEDVFDLLRDHGAALCIHDLIDDHPREITAKWTYLRFHGTGKDYGGSYKRQFLSAEAKRIRKLLDEGTDVYVYFNNDREGHAVDNALDLRRYVKGK